VACSDSDPSATLVVEGFVSFCHESACREFPAAGAVVTVRDADSQIVFSGTLNDAGVATVKGLDPGSYSAQFSVAELGISTGADSGAMAQLESSGESVLSLTSAAVEIQETKD